MKHTKLIKLTIFLGLFLLISISATENETKKLEEATVSGCEDPCTECQRTVYQMKFQGIADCEGSSVCRNTIREVWNAPFNPFEPFLKDMFGKCEICFRNGHCSISQCKEQEHNEIDVINNTINNSHLTAKVSPDLLVAFTDQPDKKALPYLLKLNQKVERTFKKDLSTALTIGSADNLIPKVQNMVKAYFDQPQAGVRGTAYSVLNVGLSKPVTGADITFFNNSKGVVNMEKITNAFGKLNIHLQEIQKFKTGASTTKGEEKKSACKIVKQEKKELTKLVERTYKLNQQLAKKEKNITRLIRNPRIQDANIKSALSNSLASVQQYRKEIKSVKSQLKDDKRKYLNNKFYIESE